MGLGHVRRAAACPVWLPESAERSRAGGGYAISLVVLAATYPTVLVFAVCRFDRLTVKHLYKSNTAKLVQNTKAAAAEREQAY
eukprot:COSAG05_NODE_1206_length_5525_cov_6.815149_9_plen_83_part_00